MEADTYDRDRRRRADAYWSGREPFASYGPWFHPRWAYEHWVHGHPRGRFCDVASEPMEKALASGTDLTTATAAPRLEADPWAGENRHWRTSRWVLRSLDGILGEWRELYGEVPPESSLLLRKYRQLYPLPAAASARGVRERGSG